MASAAVDHCLESNASPQWLLYGSDHPPSDPSPEPGNEPSSLHVSGEGTPLRMSQIKAAVAAPAAAIDGHGRMRRSFITARPLMVHVDGPIAAYKSTLLKALRNIGGGAIRVYLEKADKGNPMLHIFYQDVRRFAAAMQFQALYLRFGITMLIMEDMKKCHEEQTPMLALVERGWPSDARFAWCNMAAGNFTPEAEADYNAIFDEAMGKIDLPNLFYFVRTTAEESHARIILRGRSCEVGDSQCLVCARRDALRHAQENPGAERKCVACFKCALAFPAEEIDPEHPFATCPSCAATSPDYSTGETHVLTRCNTCGTQLLYDLRKGDPAPLSYLRVLESFTAKLQKTILDGGCPWVDVTKEDHTPEDLLDATDSYANQAFIKDYDGQISTLAQLRARAFALYEKHLAVAGLTHEAVLESHRAYLAGRKNGKKSDSA